MEQETPNSGFLKRNIDTGVLIVLILLNVFWISNYKGEPVSIAKNVGGVLFNLLCAAVIGWIISKMMDLNLFKSIKRSGIGFLALLFFILKTSEGDYTPIPSSSSNSNYGSSSGSRTCSWCGNSFTGYGYYHIFDECRKGEPQMEGNQCSMKCCMDSWNSQPHKRIDPSHL